MQVQHIYLTTEEWEINIGEQIRTERINLQLDQARLATLADISIGALSNLERGKGSSLKTLIAVLRALGRTDWLESLTPPVTVSPLQMLRSMRNAPQGRNRMRVRSKPSDPTIQ